jgi:hypothetical protein
MKNITAYRRNATLFVVVAFMCVSSVFAQRINSSIALRILGTYATGIYNQGASEIVAYDASTRRLFTVNGAASKNTTFP